MSQQKRLRGLLTFQSPYWQCYKHSSASTALISCIHLVQHNPGTFNIYSPVILETNNQYILLRQSATEARIKCKSGLSFPSMEGEILMILCLSYTNDIHIIGFHLFLFCSPFRTIRVNKIAWNVYIGFNFLIKR